MNSKMKGKNRVRVRIHPRRPKRAPIATQANSEDGEMMTLFAGRGLFDPGVKADISQIFATTMFSENSPLLEQVEVRESEPIGKRDDSSVLFSVKRLADPIAKAKRDKSLIDPTSGMIDLGRLVATHPAAAREATDSMIYTRGMGFRPDHDSPVLPVIPKHTSLLTKLAAIFGTVFVLVGIAVLSILVPTQDDGFDSHNAIRTEHLATMVSRAAAPEAEENLASPSTPVKVAATPNPKPPREKVGRDTNELDKLLGGAISKPSRERSRKKSRRSSRAKAKSVTVSKPRKLSRAQVKSGLVAVSRKVRRCNQGRATGIITVEVVINGNGRVARVHTIGSSAATSVGVCTARAVRSAKFPEFTGPRMTIQYPYRF